MYQNSKNFLIGYSFKKKFIDMFIVLRAHSYYLLHIYSIEVFYDISVL